MTELKTPEEYAEMLGLEICCDARESKRYRTGRCSHGTFVAATSSMLNKQEGWTDGRTFATAEEAVGSYESVLREWRRLRPEATRICWREAPQVGSEECPHTGVMKWRVYSRLFISPERVMNSFETSTDMGPNGRLFGESWDDDEAFIKEAAALMWEKAHKGINPIKTKA